METKNSLGGNASQERLDNAKAAWLNRYGAPESDWDTFKPQTEPRPEFSSEEELSVTLCPTPEELAFRYTSRARYHFRLAREYGPSPRGFANYREGIFFSGLARKEMKRHFKIIRMIRGGV